MATSLRERTEAPWDPAREHRFVTSDGTALFVRDTGRSAAPVTLVLAHGWTQDHRTWERVAPIVPKLVDTPLRIVSYDHRGHGASAPAPAGTATIERIADDLAELISDRVPHGPIVLAGHSMGGMAIMALAERHPKLVGARVTAAAFVATSSGRLDRVTLGLPGIAGGGAVRIQRRINLLLARHRNPTLPLRPAMVRPFARWLVFGDRPQRADLDSVVAQILCSHPASMAGFRDSMSVHDRGVALAGLCEIPTVVLGGERDRLCPPPHARAIADELPDAEFVRFPGAGHMLAHERAPEVAARIASLVRATVARG